MTDNTNDTIVTIGTKIKLMETLEMLEFDQIYSVTNYEESYEEIKHILEKLTTHLNFAFKTSNWIQLTLPNGDFFGGDTIITKSVSDSISVLAENASNKININLCDYVAEEKNINAKNLCSMLEYYIPQLAKIAITENKQVIENKLDVLGELLTKVNNQCSEPIKEAKYFNQLIKKIKEDQTNTPKSQAKYMNMLTTDPIKKIYNKVLSELLEHIINFNINKQPSQPDIKSLINKYNKMNMLVA